MRDLSVPIATDANGETLEACRVTLVECAKKLAAMRHLTKAYHREIDRFVCDMPTTGEPSWMRTVRQWGAAIASMLGLTAPSTPHL